MTLDLSQISDKLKDPLLMEWALDRVDEVEGRIAGQGASLSENWLDAATLRHWLESDDERIIARLFSYAPVECFAGLEETIAARWPRWRGRLASSAPQMLARIAPELAWTCFTQPSERVPRTLDALLGIIQSIPLLPPENGRALLQNLAPDVSRLGGDEQGRDLVLGHLLHFGLPVDPEPLLQPLRSRLAGDLEPAALDGLLKAIDAVLFGEHSYRELASDIREGRTDQSFTTLARLFRDEAPLEQLDRWCRAPVDPSEPMDLAARLAPEGAQATVLAVTETLGARELGELSGPVADFCIGVIATAHARADIQAATLPLADLIEVLAADVSPPRHFEGVLARLHDLDRDQVASALIAALESEAPTYGGVSLARAMGRLGWEELIQPLIASLGEEHGDLLHNEAQQALARIGEPAGLALLEQWEGLDSSQRIYAVGAISSIGGEPAVRLVLEHEPDLLDQDAEFWCDLIESAPDPRLLAHMEPMLRRRQHWIDRSFYLVGRLLGSDHPELDAVGERARAHRQAQELSLNAIMSGDWSTDKLTLKLQCPECGDTNLYDVRRVAVDSENAQEHLVIAEEIACASCGRYTDLTVTPDARLAILGELFRLTAMSLSKTPEKSQVLVRILGMRDGRKLPVGDLLAASEAAVAKDPDRVGEWLRLAHCYQQLLGRPRFAAGLREQVLKREPHAVEAVLLEARALDLEGETDRAFALLEQALAAKERWRFLLTDIQPPAGVARDFATLYNQLSRRLGRTDRPPLDPSRLALPRKVGRNDPCPCGSGKKYKKCCLASGAS